MTSEAASTETAVTAETPVSAEPKLLASASTKDQVISQIVAKLTPKEEPKVEAAPPPQVETPPVVESAKQEEEKISPKLARLREREAEVEAAKAELEARVRAAEEKEAKIKRMKESPIEALEAAGLSFQEVAEAVLKTGEAPTPEAAVSKEVEAIKAEIATIKKEKEDALKLAEETQAKAQEARIQAAVLDYQTRISAAITSGGDKFELVAAYEAQDLVYDIAREYFARHEKILAPEEAAQMAESFLEKRLEKVVSTKKLKSRFQPATKQQEPKTLTNGAQSYSAPVQAKTALLDREARLQEAMKRLRYT